jgi:CHAT domain-containing protein
MAQRLHDPRALAYAWGYLGRLYEEARQYPEALELTRRAVMAVRHVSMPESLYLWEWQTGRLLRALGDLPAALAAYGRAIDTVQAVRSVLLRGSSIGDTFRMVVGPLYFELVDLLLQRAAALEQHAQEAVYPQHAFYLHQARTTIELFKKEELRDYFGDACLAAAQPDTALLDRVAPDAMVVYPILLPDRTELLVSLPTGLQRIPVPVTGPDLEHQVRIFLNALADRDARRYLRHAQRLYAWLIRPLEAALAAQPVQTLVFVPDGTLRVLPLAALHDGQRFLIEKYALAITPGVILTDPRPLTRANLQVLAVGTAEAGEAFAPLSRVPEELRGIQRLYGGTVLLNQDFSPERLEQVVRRGRFGIVHIAAHGRFAPDAAESFLLTGQGKLTMERLAGIVGRLRFREHPLELLTLSACETARGDDRAALGLAGVAVQAGARSALATLWLVEDDAAARVMTAFYQHLREPAVSRAQALQRAQIALLRQPQYADPWFWAPFLLINNWL